MNISKTIENNLKTKLTSARSRIRERKDLFLDEEHELLCSYYEKYLELSKKFEGVKKTIQIPYKKIKYGPNDDYVFEDRFMKIEYFWNKYNQKFINNLNIAHYNIEGYDKEWINAQNNFITSLSPEEIHTLRCHTYDGDIIANYFLRTGSIEDHIDNICRDTRKDDTIIISKKDSETARDFILFYYQISYFIKKEVSNMNKIQIEEYIKDNYPKFDWNKILRKYVQDIGKIFKKAPKVVNEFVVYRGVYDDHHLSKSHKGRFPSSTITSVSLDCQTAIAYAGRNCCIQRIRLCKGTKAILLEGISMFSDDCEVLLPFNTTYNIDYARHEIKIYKIGAVCPTHPNSKTMIVTDLSVMSKNNSKSKSQSSDGTSKNSKSQSSDGTSNGSKNSKS